MRLSILASTTALVLSLGGCAASIDRPAAQGLPRAMSLGSSASMTNAESPVGFCAEKGCASRPDSVARGAQIGADKNAPLVEGHPLTSVVVTQCNLMVVVYMTMQDGRFLRFDKQSNISAEELLRVAYTASRSERVEVSCEGVGVAGYEKHDAV
jgi:hypothetical protein